MPLPGRRRRGTGLLEEEEEGGRRTNDVFWTTAILTLTLTLPPKVARFILNTLGNQPTPFGLSRVNTLYTLAKQAKVL